MKDKLSIENKVDNTLNSIEGIQRAMADPYFYTRLKARMERNNEGSWQRLTGFIARPVIAFATILLIVCINAFAIYTNSDSTIGTSDKTDLTAVDEYSQVTSTIYDTENYNP